LDPEQVEWVWVWPGGCGSGRKRVGETHACTHDNVDPSRSGFGWVVSRIPDDPERFHGFTDNEEDNSDDDDVLTAYPLIQYPSFTRTESAANSAILPLILRTKRTNGTIVNLAHPCLAQLRDGR
jgi:hypothetical protein